jgi:predicted CXXCH cytochrome family protein
MKKIKILSTFLAGAALLAIPTGSTGSIVGTKHDLSTYGWGTDQTCIFCHTPHNAQSSQLAPLWNHGATTATYKLYGENGSSPTFNATNTISQPTSSTTKACMSCHDGTVAMDTFGTRTGTHKMGGTSNLGTDLSNDHPVSFTYDAALATTDGALVMPVSAAFVDAARKLPLFNAKMECASCHNVHDDTNPPFLRKNNAGSALCLSCHIK